MRGWPFYLQRKREKKGHERRALDKKRRYAQGKKRKKGGQKGERKAFNFVRANAWPLIPKRGKGKGKEHVPRMAKQNAVSSPKKEKGKEQRGSERKQGAWVSLLSFPPMKEGGKIRIPSS